MLAAAVPAQADIIYTSTDQYIGPSRSYTLILPGSPVGIYNFQFGTASGSPHANVDAFFAGGAHGMVPVGFNTNSFYAAALQRGAKIGPGGIFGKFSYVNFAYAVNSDGSYRYGGQFLNKTAYLGFEFLLAGQEHFGWARVGVFQIGQFSLEAHLTGYAYDTVANQPIRAGETPEPASLGLLAVGALGLVAWRKQPRPLP